MNKIPLILCTKHRIPQNTYIPPKPVSSQLASPHGKENRNHHQPWLLIQDKFRFQDHKTPLYHTLPVQVCKLSSAVPEHRSQTKPCHGITYTWKKGGLPSIPDAQQRIPLQMTLQHSPGPSTITTDPRCDRTGKNPERGNSFASTGSS